MLIEASEIKIDESSMTGETRSIKKDTIEKCLLRKREILADGTILGE